MVGPANENLSETVKPDGQESMTKNCLSLTTVTGTIFNLNKRKEKKQLDRTGSHIRVHGPTFSECRPEDLQLLFRRDSSTGVSCEYSKFFKSKCGNNFF